MVDNDEFRNSSASYMYISVYKNRQGRLAKISNRAILS